MTGSNRVRDGEQGFTLTELLVVLTITSIIMAAVTSTVIATMRVDQVERTLQDTNSDARVAMADIRRELRAARRVFEAADPTDPSTLRSSLHFWVDQNQDSLVQGPELICYVVEELSASPPRYELMRVTDVDVGSCEANVAAGTDGARRVLARTLTDPEPFVEYSPVPGGINDPPTREVTVRLELEVDTPRNSGVTTAEGAIRLRNVP